MTGAVKRASLSAALFASLIAIYFLIHDSFDLIATIWAFSYMKPFA
jgi:hypothetical protein